MIRLTLIFVAISSLIACSNTGRPIPADFSSQSLVLSKPIEVPADAGSVLFQNGAIINRSNLSIWEHHCFFRFKELASDAVTLTEGEYLISGFNYFDEFCDRRGSCDRVNRYDLKTVSGREAIDLTCKYRIDFSTWNAENNPVILSRDQVQKTLGDWIKFSETSQ